MSADLRAGAGTGFGVYVHVPFCARRCDYCAFATWTDRGHLMEAYARACVAEITKADLPPATSVFFGGGTPSLLPAPTLVSILDAVARVPGAEVTVECNPETVDEAKLAAYCNAGVNRVSFGVQSMVPHVLGSLGRVHDVASVRRAVTAAASAGIASVNVDLIYGAAGESPEDWRTTLDAVLTLGPTPHHISAYALTVEPGTPLAADRARHPDADVQADRYLTADAVLHDAGFENYEISNWARPGHECRHNLLYWSQGDYRGIGCAAHSHARGRRWWNVRRPERYIAAIEAETSPVAGEELLDARTQQLESLQLALRTRIGVRPDEVEGLADVEAAGLARRVEGRVRLTPRGRLLANEVSSRLVVR